MRTLIGQDGVDTMYGIDDASGTVIRITFSNGNTLTQENPETKAIARVFRSGKDITDDQTDASFEWTRNSGNAAADAAWAEAHKGMKQITLTADDLAGNVLISCSLTGESTLYGSMQYVMVDDTLADKMTVTHSPNEITALGNEINRLERLEAMDREMSRPTSAPLTEKPAAAPKMDDKKGRASDTYKKAFWNQLRSKNPMTPELRNALEEGEVAEGGYLVPDTFEHTLI